MSVMIETSLGTLVVDLFCEDCPRACESFLKLCKIKYYNNVLWFNVQADFIAQTGDPTGSGRGGSSIWGVLDAAGATGAEAATASARRRYFEDEIKPKRTHAKVGTIGMASGKANSNASQWYVTLRPSIDYLDEKHTVFGEVVEGLDVLEKLNGVVVDASGRPYQDVRVKHTYVLEDPFPDAAGIASLVPDASPLRPRPVEEIVERRIADDDVLEEAGGGKSKEELEAVEARSRATVLEIIGDLPHRDVKPVDNVLFVCKLNPATNDEDLEIIFSRFGEVKSCNVIRDQKTGDSLNFAFIEFEEHANCEEAFFKMNNVIIDDRRIKVDFSQSVSKQWNRSSAAPWAKRVREHDERNAGSYGRRGGGSGGGGGGGMGARSGANSVPVRPPPPPPVAAAAAAAARPAKRSRWDDSGGGGGGGNAVDPARAARKAAKKEKKQAKKVEKKLKKKLKKEKKQAKKAQGR
jgi:peptidyl-prolyl cis-trans isomerase-like 4